MSNTWEEIEATRLAIKAMPDDHPDLGPKLHEFGYTLLTQYEEIEDSDILDEAIEHTERATSLMVGHEDLPDCLYNLFSLLYSRYEAFQELPDLVQAIEVLQKTIKAAPDDEPDIPSYHHQLGVLLLLKHSETKDKADLDDSIEAARKAVALSSEENPEHWRYLDGLANELKTRYDLARWWVDLNQAVKVTHQLEQTLPRDHEYLPTCLSRLGNLLNERGFTNRHLPDLSHSIRFSTRALDLMADESHPDKAATFFNLSVALDHKNTLVPSNELFTQSVQMARKAVAVCEDDDLRPSYLVNLGDRLRGLFLRTRDFSLLDEPIQAMRDAAKHASPTSESSPMACLGHLGGILIVKYDETGEVAALDEAMQILPQVVENTGEDDVQTLAMSLDSLASGFHHRYKLTDRLSDLEEAIKHSKLAVEKASPDVHATLTTYLATYERILGTEFLIKQSARDFDESVEYLTGAASLLLDFHANKADYLRILGQQLHRRYLRGDDVTDRDKAVEVYRQVTSLKRGEESEAATLNTLSIYLLARYHQTDATSDLEEAIDVARRAVEATPHIHPSQAQHLTNLGTRLLNRATRLSKQGEKVLVRADLKEAVTHFQAALHSAGSTSMDRIHAGALILEYCSDTLQAYEAAGLTVHLVSKMVLRSLRQVEKQRLLGWMSGLGCNAAAVALQADAGATAALELLEMGRGLLSTALSDLRADLGDLKVSYPEMAENYTGLCDMMLSYLGSDNDDGVQTTVTTRVGLTQSYHAGKELDELVEKIRTLPEFGDFLKAPTESEARAAAGLGPIVIINIGDKRCDALLVEPPQIRALEMKSISKQDLEMKAATSNLGSPVILEWLWDAITKPILDALGFTKPPSQGDAWPHIWWIPTGPLIKFPLHAAGYHQSGTGETVLDRVISSYGPSIRAIIQSRRRSAMKKQSSSVNNESTRAVLVAMERTPNQTSLPYAGNEIVALREVLESKSVDLAQPVCKKQPVLSSLSECHIFHFAGHGLVNKADPSKSCLLLEDWQRNPLTVASLLQKNLHQTSPLLAYLSACGTGRVKDDSLTDEGIHLINAYQLAGFRHVIGTLWEVADDICVDMAKLTYKELCEGGMNDESVSLGLHKATRALRDSWLDQQGIMRSTRKRKRNISASLGNQDHDQENIQSLVSGGSTDVRDIEDDVESEDVSALWVPYIHFGP